MATNETLHLAMYGSALEKVALNFQKNMIHFNVVYSCGLPLYLLFLECFTNHTVQLRSYMYAVIVG